MSVSNANKVEFGDFQTPLGLADRIVSFLLEEVSFESVIEPTCGLGGFLVALHRQGVHGSKLHGWEINPGYAEEANKILAGLTGRSREYVKTLDFFKIDWASLLAKHEQPILFIGNPPWVTNAELGKLSGNNLPKKINFASLSGLDAMTGKSNFDVSESMLIKILESVSGTRSAMSFLIKTSVARKLLLHSAKNGFKMDSFSIRRIDARKEFNVSVDACLFTAKGSLRRPADYGCQVHESLDRREAGRIMGVRANRLIANVKDYENLSFIDGTCEFKWRSGVKHDCSKVMEFWHENGALKNGLGEAVNVSSEFLYPMYKSSDIAKRCRHPPKKYMLITQRKIGEETDDVKRRSAETWNYLLDHENLFEARKSSIYANSPRFSIFGVGEYTFAPWKIAISGLYKNIRFSMIGSHDDKPIVLDDTCYMLGFDSCEKATLIHELLTSPIVDRFIQSIVFPDGKRPITASLLNRIRLSEVAKIEGKHRVFTSLFGVKQQSKLAV